MSQWVLLESNSQACDIDSGNQQTETNQQTQTTQPTSVSSPLPIIIVLALVGYAVTRGR